MFCNNCGFRLDEDAKFCTNCGTRIESKIVKVEEPVVAPVAEEAAAPVVNETVVVSEPVNTPVVESFANAAPEQPVQVQKTTEPAPAPKKKKSKKGLWIGFGIASVILAALSVFVALNFSTVKNFVKKTVSSDEEYFKYIHEE